MKERASGFCGFSVMGGRHFESIVYIYTHISSLIEWIWQKAR